MKKLFHESLKEEILKPESDEEDENDEDEEEEEEPQERKEVKIFKLGKFVVDPKYTDFIGKFFIPFKIIFL